MVVAERGVSSSPPLGASRPWPAAARAAVAPANDGWIVELAVPLSAFEAADPDGCWRVNFTRFATAGGEASSFAGARRYFYHPGNLGTMILVGDGGSVRTATTRPAGS